MKGLVQFLNEAIVNESKVSFNSVSEDAIEYFDDLRKKVGVRDGKLPTEEQFKKMVDIVIKEGDYQRAYDVLMLFEYEYGEVGVRKAGDINKWAHDHFEKIEIYANTDDDEESSDPEHIFVLRRTYDKAEPKVKEYIDHSFHNLLKLWGLKSCGEIPDYNDDAVRLAKFAFNKVK